MDCLAFGGTICGGGGGIVLGTETACDAGIIGVLTGLSFANVLSVRLGSRLWGAFSASLCFALDAMSVS
jgi:hypothetical protein